MDNFHYRLKFGDVEVEANGSLEFVKEIKKFSEDLISNSLLKRQTLGAIDSTLSRSENQDQSRESKPIQNSESIKQESLAEFLERLPNKTHQDKILAFGFYLEKVKSLQNFGVKEINDCYSEVKESKSNTAQFMVLLIKSGLIMKSSASGQGGAVQYVLTRKGEHKIKSQIGL